MYLNWFFFISNDELVKYRRVNKARGQKRDLGEE